MSSQNAYEFEFKAISSISRPSRTSRVMPHQESKEDEDLETLKRELSEAKQTLHETLEKMNKIKEDRQLKVEEIWQVHDASAEVSRIQRKIVKTEKKK
mgnify:FL=1